MTSSHCIDTLAAWPQHGTLFVAFELGKGWWKLGLAMAGGRLSLHTLKGGDAERALWLIAKGRAKLERQLGRPVRVVSCYEAGYDGFWLHRWLVARGIDNRVLDPASILVNRRKRRAKTDRLDLEQLIAALMRHVWGDEVLGDPGDDIAPRLGQISATEGKRSRWGGWPSKPERVARRLLVGSTPTLFRQFPSTGVLRRPTPSTEDQ